MESNEEKSVCNCEICKKYIEISREMTELNTEIRDLRNDKITIETKLKNYINRICYLEKSVENNRQQCEMQYEDN